MGIFPYIENSRMNARGFFSCRTKVFIYTLCIILLASFDFFMSSTLTNLTHKQLFLTDCKISKTEMLIENKDLINQVRKVLRLQKGDAIYVQNE